MDTWLFLGVLTHALSTVVIVTRHREMSRWWWLPVEFAAISLPWFFLMTVTRLLGERVFG